MLPVPVVVNTALLTRIPEVGSGLVPAVFAVSVMLPLTTLMPPRLIKMLRVEFSVIVPVPLVEIPVEIFRTLVVSAERFLLAASASVPVKSTSVNGLAFVPIVRLALKSGTAATVMKSVALPRLIVSEPLGLAKSVVSIVPPLRRDKVLPLVPSSWRVMLFSGPAGKLKTTSVAVPLLVIG